MKRVFPQYRDKTFDEFIAIGNPDLESALNVAKRYANDLKLMKSQGRGITFLGQNGVGKTHLASCVIAEAEDRGYKIECIELSSYIDMHLEMFRVNGRIRDGYEEDQERSFDLDQRLRYIKSGASFLLLDDLGREHESQSGWSTERVFDLLRYRYNRLLPTLITTNLPFDKLDARYTEGMSSFLREATIPVVMDGEDYRHRIADASWSARD